MQSSFSHETGMVCVELTVAEARALIALVKREIPASWGRSRLDLGGALDTFNKAAPELT